MGAWCLLEMCVDLLDENRFILNICSAESSDAVNFGSRYTRRLESQHGLEIVLQLCYGRGHDEANAEMNSDDAHSKEKKRKKEEEEK